MAEELGRIAYARGLIQRAKLLGLIDLDAAGRLDELLDQRAAMAGARVEAQAPAVPAAVPVMPPTLAATLPAPREVRGPAPVRKLVPARPPAAWRLRSRQARDVVLSDLGVHGLAYLGVLLTFGGLFGLMFFAFGQVKRDLRPAAEIAIPVVMFGWGRVLRRLKAPLVGKGLTILGGAMLPVVAFAAFVDGAAIPPDLTRGALIAALAATSAALGLAYWAWSARHPDSVLRYLAAPLGWTAVLAIGFVFERRPLIGIGIEHIVPLQAAVAAAAVSLSLALFVRERRHPFARASLVPAVPGVALAFVLTVLTEIGEGWPATPVLVAGGATLIGTELLGAGLSRRFANPVLQTVIGVIALGAAVPELGVARTGMIGALVFLALLEWHGRRSLGIGALPLAAGIACGLAMSSGEARSMLVAWGVLALWAHGRRIVARGSWSTMGIPVTVASAVLPIGAGAALLRWLPREQAWIVLAGMTLAVVVAVRARRSTDGFWTWWTLGASTMIVAGAGTTWLVQGGSAVSATVASGVGTLAMLGSTAKAIMRVWASAAAAAVTIGLGFEATGLSPHLRPAVGAGVAFAVLAAASVARNRASDHAVTAGHVAAALLLVGARDDWAGVAVLGAWTAGWAVATVASETGHAGVARILRVPEERYTRALPAVLLAASSPFLVILAASRSNEFSSHPAWTGVALAAVGAAYAVVPRAVRDRLTVAVPFAVGALLLNPVGLAIVLTQAPSLDAALSSVPAIFVGALGIAAIATLLRTRRYDGSLWYAWGLFGLEVVLVGHRLGVPTRLANFIGLGWGAIVCVAALALDDVREGRRSPGELLRTRWLEPPVVLGAASAALGFLPALTRGATVAGAWSLAFAAIATVVAWQLRAGWVTFVTYGLGIVGFANLWPGHPADRPWLFAMPAAALCGAAWLARARFPREKTALRWDLAPFVVAWGTAAAALTEALITDEILPTWGSFGALALASAAVLHSGIWETIGTGLVLVAAREGGHWWLAGALLATAVWNGMAALRSTTATRWLREVASVVAAGAAFGELLTRSGWTVTTDVVATALTGGGVAVAAAVALRTELIRREWAAGWAVLGSVGVATAAFIAPGAEAQAWNGFAGGLALLGLAAVMGARPAGVPALREIAALFSLGALQAVATAQATSAYVRAFGALGTAAAGTAASFVVWSRSKGSPWHRPLALLGLGAGLAAIAYGAVLLPDRRWLAAAIALTGLQTATTAYTLEVRPLAYLAPPQLAAAWILYASQALAGNPEWFTVPIGLALLLTTGLVRRDRRRARRPVVTPDVIVLEMSGAASLVGAALVQTVTSTIGYGALALALSSGIAVWGAFTHVRRRVAAGAALDVLALFLMIAAPVARLVPQIHGATLWIAVAGIGAVLILIAATLEQGRARVRSAMAKLADLTRGWE